MMSRLCALALLLSVVVTLGLVLGPSQAAAAGNAWAPATLLRRTQNQVTDPAVAVDQAGGVHVFWVERLQDAKRDEANSEVFYTGSQGSAWSIPTDVIAMSGAGAPSAAIDASGRLTLFWHQTSGALFRTEARVADADRASAWAAPVNLGATNSSSEVVADERGRLYLAYPGQSRAGVLYQYSDDGGQTWSFPLTITPAAPGSSADDVRLAVAPDGTLHVVWTEFQAPGGWPPLGVFYSRSEDRGRTWTAPLQVAQAGFTQGSIAAGPNGKVFIAWNGMSGVVGRYSRWSSDGGITWSSPSILQAPATSLTSGGSTGPPGLVIDSAGNAHVLFVQDNRVWYSAWQGQGWNEPEYIPSGDEAGLPPPSQGIDGKVRHIEQALMTIGLGNQLHVVFWDERPGQPTSVWYATRRIDAPGVPARPFAAPHVQEQVAPQRPSQPSPADPSSGFEDAGLGRPLPQMPPDVRLFVIVGILPIVLGLAGVVGVRAWMIRR